MPYYFATDELGYRKMCPHRVPRYTDNSTIINVARWLSHNEERVLGNYGDGGCNMSAPFHTANKTRSNAVKNIYVNVNY
jgi:hypothetical protein